jgi:IclR family transcriptional regulator, acetate operon repressor
LESYGKDTITDAAALRAELAQIRRDGYSVNRNQYRPGVFAIAGAVLDADGTPVAAVVMSTPESRYEESRLPELGRLVADTAAEISARLGR